MVHDKSRALDVIEFIQMLHHTGDFYGKLFRLLDWEHQIISDVYGTVNEKGYRQYQYAYLEIPKKNGKTELTAGLASYHLFNDPPSGQIYCCAAEKEQAALVYQAAKCMIEQDKALTKMVDIIDSKKMIVNKRTGTFIKVLSAEAYSKHGINPTVVIFDELHAQQSRDLWDTMTFGAGAARKEPLWWVITTAGEDPDRLSIGWEVHEYARKVLEGEIEDPIWYAKMYGAKEDDDIYDEEVWYRVNPSLGCTIEIEKVRQEAIGARNDLGKERLFRWLRLNQWISVKKLGWLPLTLWDSCNGEWNISDLIGKKCYAGLDLSSTTDLTGLVLLFPPQKGFTDWRFICEAWIPDNKMKERQERDNVPYERWVQEHHLNVTPGDAVDYEIVEGRIITLSKLYKFESLNADPWNSHMLTQRLSKEGLNVIEIPQNMKNMSPAMKEVERLLRTHQMTHDKNPVARWCFGNVNIAIDGNENIKPMKNKSRDRIDITVALINAMSRAFNVEKVKCPYNANRGILEA
jgi:phage terminase large subunit-like protein